MRPMRVPWFRMSRKRLITFDAPSDEIVKREAQPGDVSAYVRAAVIEKAARDQQRSELDELRARLDRVERKLNELS